jgi:NitT/TauT family transport system substrate-binding protein
MLVGGACFGFADDTGAALPKDHQEGKSQVREEMTMINRVLASCLAIAAPLVASQASAQEVLKIAIGQINNWENQAPTLGQEAGIFKKYNLTIEATGTQGAGETLQAVISGSADLGAGVGVSGVMRAYSRGAPVRILLPAFTGTGDLYWYVKADSPLKELKDATPSNTIAYSTNGSTSHNIVVAFADELGLKAKPTATGGPPSTLTQVMSGQIDIGWAAPPFGVRELNESKIRILARGSDVPSLRNQTVRAIVVNANALKEKRDAILRFVQAYRESVEWMYANPQAAKMYAEKIKQSEDLITQSIERFHPKAAMQSVKMEDLDGAVKDAVRLKFLDKALTADQLVDMVQIPPAN